MRPLRMLLGAAAFAGVLVDPAAAHEVRRVGALEVLVGWADEPPIAGFRNAVQVRFEGPRADEAELEVLVVFGDGEASTAPLPLEPSFDDPAEYRATIIPTRAGSYRFDITGDVAGNAFEESFSSGPDTFDDVRNPADLEFPAQDPTRGELAQAVERISGRVDAGSSEQPPADALARWVSAAALVLAVLALVMSRRRGGTSRS